MSAQAQPQAPQQAPYVAPTEAPAFIQPNTLGTYDSMHEEVNHLLPAHSLFQGASLRISRAVGNHLQVTHALSLNGANSNYHFSPTYIGNYHHTVPNQGGLPVLLGDITPDGSVIAQVIHEFNNSVSMKLQAQSKRGKWAGGQLEGFLTGNKWAGSLKLVNIDVFHNSGVVVGNYLQAMTPKLSLGGELMFQYSPDGEQTSLSLAARYKTPVSVSGLTLSPMGVLQASYFAAVSQRAAVATQLDVDLRQMDSTFNFGFQYNFREATFRGQISSQGKVSGFLEKTVMPGMKFNLCGQIDHMSGDTSFGVGFTIG